jgi:hypothetical protein
MLALVFTSNYTAYSHSISDDQDYIWSTSMKDEIPGGRFYVYSTKVFGPRWFYQWVIPDPTATWDAGYRITIDTVPEPSSVLLGMLAVVALISLPHRRPRV